MSGSQMLQGCFLFGLDRCDDREDHQQHGRHAVADQLCIRAVVRADETGADSSFPRLWMIRVKKAKHMVDLY